MAYTSGGRPGWEACESSFGPMAEEVEVLLLLGGNVGRPVETLQRAEEAIGARCGRIVARSRDHWTEPWGFSDERLFLNRALLVRSASSLPELLATVLSIETELGRVRDPLQRFAARTIDIDLLLAGERILTTPDLVLPHPRLHQRAFALAPAVDIVPHWRHPLLGRTVLQLLNDLRGLPA